MCYYGLGINSPLSHLTPRLICLNWSQACGALGRRRLWEAHLGASPVSLPPYPPCCELVVLRAPVTTDRNQSHRHAFPGNQWGKITPLHQMASFWVNISWQRVALITNTHYTEVLLTVFLPPCRKPSLNSEVNSGKSEKAIAVCYF